MPADAQLELWGSAVADAFVPVGLRRRDDGPFISSVRSRALGPITVATIESQAQDVLRSGDHIADGAGDVFFLNLPLSDGASVSQRSRSARLRPGDFALVDSAAEFELDFEQAFQQITLTIPHDCLSPLLGTPDEATAVRVPGDRGVGAVAAGAIVALAHDADPCDGHAARALSEHVTGLVALAVGGLRRLPRRTGRELLVQAIQDEIDRSLGDPDLDPATVADRVGVSTRYLHRLLADSGGPSFARRLLTRRLERCRGDLEDPGKAHWTIAEIACARGFDDPSHFARAFRARHGTTPSLHRREAALEELPRD